MTGALALAAEHDAVGNHDEAINALVRVVQACDIEAMVELGKRFVIGDRTPFLPQDGLRLLADAMEAGSVEATLRLAAVVALGAHTEQSWGGALTLLVRAADKSQNSVSRAGCFALYR